MSENLNNTDPEFAALTTIYTALSSLDTQTQTRVLDYVIKRLNLQIGSKLDQKPCIPDNDREEEKNTNNNDSNIIIPEDLDDTDGVNVVAIKWMKRNGLSVKQLQQFYSFDSDEIDLIAKVIPGEGKKVRTRHVTLLKAVAAFLSTGAARITAEQIKEACLHYDAYDLGHHAQFLKSMNSEMNGNKESGYTLTPRGMTAAKDLLREMLS